MKFKKITMKFHEPLTKVIFYQGQNVTQEEILRADVEGIRVKVKRELNKVIRGVNMVRIMSPAMFDLLKFHIMNMERSFDRLVSFEKVDDLTYELIYPMDTNALFTIKDIASKLGPLKKFALGRLENKDLQIVKVLREQELITAFEKFSFVEMKLESGTYGFFTEEVEADPDAPKTLPEKVASEPETTQKKQSDIPQSSGQGTEAHQTSSSTAQSPESEPPKE